MVADKTLRCINMRVNYERAKMEIVSFGRNVGLRSDEGGQNSPRQTA